jgi:hypothetical protein
MKLTDEQRRALRLLAGSPGGCTEAIMLAHGFTIEMLARLIVDGFAAAEPEHVRPNGRSIKITRMQITEAGGRALA